MIEPGSGATVRTRRFILWTLLVAEIAVGVLAVVLVRHGRKLVVPLALEHAVAYAWVAVTIAAAVGAYLLAGRGAGPQRLLAPSRVALAAGLSHLAALAGIGAFYLLEIWPMLAIGGLAALAGLALAYPASAPAAADASTEGGVPEDATSLPR